MCEFCIKYNEFSKNNKILFCSEHFYIIPDILPLTKGHILIVSKRHVIGMRSLNVHEFNELHDIILHIKYIYENEYKIMPTFFEHGSYVEGSYSGNSIYHFHLHCVVLKNDLINHANDKTNAPKHTIDNFKTISFKNYKEYLLVHRNNTVIYNLLNIKLESQFLRKVIYELKDEPYKCHINDYNWKVYKNTQIYANNNTELLKLFPEKKLKDCVFCASNVFSDQQILEEDEFFYLCVPKGQILEGFLLLVSKEHISSGMKNFSFNHFQSINKFIEKIAFFYKKKYSCNNFIFYEQGRGADGSTFDYKNLFKHHFHLCFLPDAYDIDLISKRYTFKHRMFDELQDITLYHDNSPYFLIAQYSETQIRFNLFTPYDENTHNILNTFRFKEILKDCYPHLTNSNWRSFEDELIIAKVIKKYNKMKEGM